MTTSAHPRPLAPVIEDADLLAGVRDFTDQIEAAELGLFVAALEWAHRNPGEVLASYSEHWWRPELADLLEWERLARESLPLVDDASIPEFAYAAHISHRAARTLIRDALVLYYRFPRVWAHMAGGHVPTWRARIVAQKGRGLVANAALFVDVALSQKGIRFTSPQVERAIDEARLRYEPEEVEAERRENEESRSVHIDTRSMAHTGLAALEGYLELPDALDLEAALAHGAARLKELGSQEPLHVRRSHALGDLARSAQGTPLDSERTQWEGTGVPETGVKLVIHLNHTAVRCLCAGSGPSDEAPLEIPASALEAITPTPPVPDSHDDPIPRFPQRSHENTGEVARVEGTALPTVLLAPEQIRSWFTRPTLHPDQRPTLVIRQVLDSEEYISTETYEVPERLREQTRLSSATCVFPYCSASARTCESDHITPYNRGGPTCSCNLAPLCTTHHRIKTHGQHHEDHRWTYAPLGRSKYLWSGPNGIHLLRTPAGTLPVAGDVFDSLPDGSARPGVLQADGTHSSLTEDHPAYTFVTKPEFLPKVDTDGAPKARSRMEVLRLSLQQRALTPLSKGQYTPYAARGGDEFYRPHIQLIRDATILGTRLANGTMVYTDVYPYIGGDGPPPF